MSAIRRTIQKGLDPIAAGLGFELRRRTPRLRLYTGEAFEDRAAGIHKIQYGCFQKVLPGWVNVDLVAEHKALAHCDDPDIVFFSVDLTQRHPFPDARFDFAFGEDFLEHLTQADALIFLTEAYRTLRPGGVLRLSFPGLEGVLDYHYTQTQFDVAAKAKRDAYDGLGHHHFFSQEELRVVAQHMGYGKVEFFEFGESRHQELAGLETRGRSVNINTYVELTK